MSTAEDFKALGNQAFANKDYDEAIKQFTNAIELDRTNHVLFSNRSAAFAGKRSYRQALEDADETIKLAPTFSKGFSRKGSALHGLRDYEGSIAAFNEGLAVEPSSALLKKGLAEVEKAKEREELEGGGGADPMGKMFSDPDMMAKLAANPKTQPLLADPAFMQKLRAIQQNPALTSSAFSDPRMIQVIGVLMGVDLQAFDRPEGTADTPGGFDPSHPERSDPTPPPAPSSSSSSSSSSSKPQPAAAAAAAASSSSSSKSAPTPAPAPAAAEPAAEEEQPMEVDGGADDESAAKGEAEALKQAGNVAYKSRQFDEAIAKYEAAWAKWPKDISFLTNLAAVYYEQGEYDQAIKTCERAADEGRELRADYKMIAKAYGRMGTSYQAKDELDQAIRYFEKSLTEHRTADILAKLRAVEKQKKERDVAAYVDPAKAELARNTGNELFKKGDFVGAVREYTEAIKRLPSDPKAYNNRASAYTKLAALPEALKDANTAISLDPSFVKAYIRKSLVLSGMRDYTRAIEACAEATDADKEGKNTREIEGQMRKCYELQQQERAGETEQQTLERAMKDPEVAQIMQDPVMRNILEQAQSDPRALQDHMKSPLIRQKIMKLEAAGVIRLGSR